MRREEKGSQHPRSPSCVQSKPYNKNHWRNSKPYKRKPNRAIPARAATEEETEVLLGEKWRGDLRKRNSTKARPIIPTVSGSEEEKVKQLRSRGLKMAHLQHSAERCRWKGPSRKPRRRTVRLSVQYTHAAMFPLADEEVKINLSISKKQEIYNTNIEYTTINVQ